MKVNTIIMPVIENESINNDYVWFWFWLCFAIFILFIIVVHLLLQKKAKACLYDSKNNKFKSTDVQNIDMDNLINSINKSNILYKELICKCHPDRFINDTRQKNAEDIFQEITNNKRNYKRLIELKERAIRELNVEL